MRRGLVLRARICEARGDIRGATNHREEEVRLIKRLHEISQKSPKKQTVLRLHGYDDLSDRLDLLAALYHECGQLPQAIQTLRESKRLCQQHGIPFDGEEMLRQYLSASGNSQKDRAASRPADSNGRRKERRNR
jgi:hypothetical protein